jgi:hypothetical protein
MATQYANSKIVTNGLVLLLDAADKNSYPGSGTVWRDVSGNGNNGTLIDGPTFDPANGGSIYTNGDTGGGDYPGPWVSTNYSGSATDSYTFSAWFKNDSFSGDKYVLGRGRDGPGAGPTGWSLIISVAPSGIVGITTLTMNPPYTVGGANSTTALQLNKWYYLTGVHTAGSTTKCYVNGILEGTGTNPGSGLRTSPGVYGGWWLASVAETPIIYTSGYTAIAQVYNRVLTDAEVLQNYNAQKSRFNL